jgi:putative FmdB family regulatory protein
VPIYEFRCSACRKRTSVFVRSVTSVARPACEHCGSKKTERVFSRVAVLRGDDGMDRAESSLGDVDENDPRSVAKWVRKMSREMGEPLDADMQTELERLESGETADDPDDPGDDTFGDALQGRGLGPP